MRFDQRGYLELVVMNLSSFVFELERHVPRCHDGCEMDDGLLEGFGFRLSAPVSPRTWPAQFPPSPGGSCRRYSPWHAVGATPRRSRAPALSLAREVGSQSPLQLLLLLASGVVGQVRIKSYHALRSPDGKDHATSSRTSGVVDRCVHPSLEAIPRGRQTPYNLPSPASSRRLRSLGPIPQHACIPPTPTTHPQNRHSSNNDVPRPPPPLPPLRRRPRAKPLGPLARRPLGPRRPRPGRPHLRQGLHVLRIHPPGPSKCAPPTIMCVCTY